MWIDRLNLVFPPQPRRRFKLHLYCNSNHRHTVCVVFVHRGQTVASEESGPLITSGDFPLLPCCCINGFFPPINTKNEWKGKSCCFESPISNMSGKWWVTNTDGIFTPILFVSPEGKPHRLVDEKERGGQNTSRRLYSYSTEKQEELEKRRKSFQIKTF